MTASFFVAAMRGNVFHFIETAYKCDNPVKALESVPVESNDMIDLLVNGVDLSIAKQPETLVEDVLSHRNGPKTVSEIALQCKFIHFATSMVIIWRTPMVRLIDELAQNVVDMALHSPRGGTPRNNNFLYGMVAYVEPNRPIPFVCINATKEGTVQLCHFGGPKFPTRFRIIAHIMRAVDHMETLKLAFDTTGPKRDPITFSQGSAIQISVRLDSPEGPFAAFLKPNPDFDCVVYLTFGGGSGAVYHKTKEKLLHSFIE